MSITHDDPPATPVSTATAPHYAWGDGCDGWHLLRAAGLSVIEERMPAGAREVRHRHAHARQLFYVLAGTLTLEVEGTTHALAPRQALEVAPGAAHQALNVGDAPCEFLVVSQPPSHGDREPAPLS
ncbi:cupin domain-containing protein [Roseisolibacter sp. H3M3-2]|uniref:cupin domain-containing protein n=1 Tax=Roseisolibacter sp. H3M3-2 TaxID=3031323 RepID=UPI0023DB932F|nr:cupin domain-containing protein [Roseisolibacter sp. H3M3-2]MDF1504122.1 cupin domain-containing protein [Roseisolibacter sp. H3M3-2]